MIDFFQNINWPYFTDLGTAVIYVDTFEIVFIGELCVWTIRWALGTEIKKKKKTTNNIMNNSNFKNTNKILKIRLC